MQVSYSITLLDDPMNRLHHFLSFILLVTFASAQPAIRLGFTEMGLGEIYHGETRTVPLTVKNTGNAPLTITGVESSCGCTTAKRPTQPIAPGATDTITIAFNSLGFSGRVTKIVTVYSDDRAHSPAEARLTGTVISVLESVPPMQVISLGGSTVGVKSTTPLQFRNVTDRTVTIRAVTGPDTSINAAFPSAGIAPFDTVTIPFTFTPASKNFQENYFYFETSHPHQPRIPFRYMYIGR